MPPNARFSTPPLLVKTNSAFEQVAATTWAPLGEPGKYERTENVIGTIFAVLLQIIALMNLNTCLFILLILPLTGCRKTDNPTPPNTAGIGGMRNWHVTYRSIVHRSIAPDSAVYSDTTYPTVDKSFELGVYGADTVLFSNEKYGYSETVGSNIRFIIWHKRYSGSQNSITYNRDSNTVKIYTHQPGANAESETWYNSF